MANFDMHISTSCTVGIGLAGVAYACGFPAPTCVLAGGLCGLAGILPDLDHDTGTPLKEMLSFSAAAVACMMQERWRHLGLQMESLALAGVLTYILIRFAVGGFLRHMTVHRGMFHSLPAALIAGLLAFLACHSHDMPGRYLKAGAVVLGYLVHLMLDEIYSIEVKATGVRLKSSSGTAMKLYGEPFVPNMTTYTLLGLLTYVAIHDPYMMEQYRHRNDPAEMTAFEPPQRQDEPAPKTATANVKSSSGPIREGLKALWK